MSLESSIAEYQQQQRHSTSRARAGRDPQSKIRMSPSELLSLEHVDLYTFDVVVKELIRKEKSLENFEGIISNLFLLEREV